MRIWTDLAISTLLTLAAATCAAAGDGNRFVDHDESYDPYRVGLDSARLTTPQWVGEEGVEAVVILSIDDYSGGAEPFESFLRPIQERLQKIDGRAPVSVVATKVNAEEPAAARWARMGTTIETHTIDHRTPVLAGGDLAASKRSFDATVDQVESIEHLKGAVGFRAPCCDSQAVCSPRFYSEVIGRVTPRGHFLRADSSVLLMLTAADPDLPRHVGTDEQGQHRFGPYVPNANYRNYVENYPYPYVIGNKIWEFPAMLPSDWQSQNRQGNAHPRLLEDWRAALDGVVAKRGCTTFMFHAGGWSSSKQLVELIDYADRTYGKKIKFLNMREAVARLEANLLAGHSLRDPKGGDNNVRLLDVNGDRLLDVVIANQQARKTRVWNPKTASWAEYDFPFPVDYVRFGAIDADGRACVLVNNEQSQGLMRFTSQGWQSVDHGLAGIEKVATSIDGRDRGVRFRDLNGDGVAELVVGNESVQAVYEWQEDGWHRLPFSLPEEVAFVDERGRDAGLRMVDVNEDGYLDVVFSDAKRYHFALFTRRGSHAMESYPKEDDPKGPEAFALKNMKGWRTLKRGAAGEEGAIRPIVREDGTGNGAWFAHRRMWIQNEQIGGSTIGPVAWHHYTSFFLSGEREPPCRSPEEALHSFHIRPGFRIETAVAEPLTMDPVDFAWGPDGRLWIVEMADYPLGLSPDGHVGLPDPMGVPCGRVRYLEDTDGDGTYDKSTLFLDKLSFPTGIMAWRNGVIVTGAPLVFYAEDTTGDGKGDRIVPLYSGFGEGNQQHRVNHPRWRLDNWISIANGDSDGGIVSERTKETLSIAGRDLRIKPDEGEMQTLSGKAQFGRNRDDWGNWFGCNNNRTGWHYHLDDIYMRRNPHCVTPALWHYVNGSGELFPAGRVMTHYSGNHQTPAEGSPGHCTSISGASVYRDTLLGENYQNDYFISDSVYNVVHHLDLEANGVLLMGNRPEDERRCEFLASSDPWFRPATIRTGPDGAMWVADVYRFVIEHTEWINDELERTLRLRNGSDKGRLYKIYPVGKKPRAIPDLTKLGVVELVGALETANGWQRDMAHQMLLWKPGKTAVAPLKKLARESELPQARLHAICVLDGLKAVSEDVLVAALQDDHPGVRRHAVRISETHAAEYPKVAQTLETMLDDEDPFVLQQLAYSLGEWKQPRSGKLLGKLALRALGDDYLTAAVMSSAGPHADAMVEAVKSEQGGPARIRLALRLQQLKNDIDEHGLKPSNEVVRQSLDEFTIGRATSPEIQAAKEKYKDALTLTGDPDEGKKLYKDNTCSVCHRLDGVGENIGPDLLTLVDRTPAVLFEAIVDPNLAVKDRYVRYAVLTTNGLAIHGQILQETSNTITIADVDGKKHPILVRDVEEIFSDGLSSMPEKLEQKLTVQQVADLMAFVARASVPKGGTVAANGPTRSARPDGDYPVVAMNEAGQLVLSSEDAQPRGPSIRYQPEWLSYGYFGSGDRLHWKVALETETRFDCIMEWAMDDQNAGRSYVLRVEGLESGEPPEPLSGKVASTGSWETYKAEEIGQMVLPAGEYNLVFEASDQSGGWLIDIRNFVWIPASEDRQPDGEDPAPTAQEVEKSEFPVLSPDADGKILLTAKDGVPVGPKIAYMPKWKAHGFFTCNDRVVWKLKLDKPGDYDCRMTWSVDPGSAGNPYRVRVSGLETDAELPVIEGKVAATESWETFETARIGKIRLPAGEYRMILDPTAEFDNHLMDLRSLEFVPVKTTP